MGTSDGKEIEALFWFVRCVVLPLTLIGSCVSSISKNYVSKKFNKIIYTEMHKPTKQDSTYFFQKHKIDTIYIGKEIPYSEIKRVVDENSLEKSLK